MAAETRIGLVMSEQAEAARTSLAPLWLAVLAVFALAFFYHWPHALDHDVADFLASAHLANHGERLYVDIVEINTPAAIDIGRLSDFIATNLHTPLDQTHMAVLLALSLLATVLSLVVLAPLLRQPGAGRWCITVGVSLSLMLTEPEIGSREQLCCLGLLPWAFAIASADRFPIRPQLGILVGLVAGFALFVKPHFVLYALAFGFIDLARARGRFNRLQLATWVAAAVSIALYVWLMLSPGYLSEMTPLGLETLGRYKTALLPSLWEFVKSGKAPLMLAALGLFYLLLRPTSDTRFPILPASLGAGAIIVSAVIYVLQGFDYGYQLMPLKTSLNLSAVFVLAWLLPSNPAARPAPGGVRAWVVFGLLALGLVGWWAPALIKKFPTREAMLKEPLFAALKPPNPGDGVLVLSPSVDPTSNYLTMMDVTWSGPMIGFVPTPALISQNGRTGINHPPPPEVRERWANWVREKTAASFAKHPPVRVAVEISDKPIFFDNAGFDLLAWFRENPDFDVAWRKADLVKVGVPVHWRWRSYQ